MSSVFPPSLYTPAPKDLLAQYAPQRVMRLVDVSQDIAFLATTVYTVPNDMICVVTGLTTLAIAGGAFNVQTLEFRVDDPSAVTLAYITRMTYAEYGMGAAPATMDVNWAGQVILMPKEAIVAGALFSLNHAANRVRSSFNGYLIPRGNWQLG